MGSVADFPLTEFQVCPRLPPQNQSGTSCCSCRVWSPGARWRNRTSDPLARPPCSPERPALCPGTNQTRKAGAGLRLQVRFPDLRTVPTSPRPLHATAEAAFCQAGRRAVRWGASAPRQAGTRPSAVSSTAPAVLSQPWVGTSTPHPRSCPQPPTRCTLLYCPSWNLTSSSTSVHLARVRKLKDQACLLLMLWGGVLRSLEGAEALEARCSGGGPAEAQHTPAAPQSWRYLG